MIFQVTFKNPDALDDALDRVGEDAAEEAKSLCKDKWFRYGGYVTIEIDTEKETATVVEL